MFENQGENWNEANQEVLSRFKQVNFVKYAYPKYEHMGQLRDTKRFLLENTDLAYFSMIQKWDQIKIYGYLDEKSGRVSHKKATFEDLNELAENFSEK